MVFIFPQTLQTPETPETFESIPVQVNFVVIIILWEGKGAYISKVVKSEVKYVTVD